MSPVSENCRDVDFWPAAGDLWDKYETDFPNPTKTLLASIALADRRVERLELAVFILDRLELDDFRFSSGRINQRKLATVVIDLVSERNAKLGPRQRKVHEVGLRSMEQTIKLLIREK